MGWYRPTSDNGRLDSSETRGDQETHRLLVVNPDATEHGTDLSLGVRDTAASANVADFILNCLEDDLYVHDMPKVADA